MKRIVTLGILSLLVGFYSVIAIAGNETHSPDSVPSAVKLDDLRSRRDDLHKLIKAEDAKRNRQTAGVSAATLEIMNDRQDSLCLELRSQLIDVVLQIKEAVKSKSALPHFAINGMSAGRELNQETEYDEDDDFTDNALPPTISEN